MKRICSLIGPIVMIGVYLLCAAPLGGMPWVLDPAAQGTTFYVYFPDNSYIVATSNDVIALQPNEAVSVNVRMPGNSGQPPDEYTGPTINIEALDGGYVTGSPTTADWSGTFSYTFQAPPNPGIAQVDMHTSTAEIGLQFFVIDPNDPNNHPVTIN